VVAPLRQVILAFQTVNPMESKLWKKGKEAVERVLSQPVHNEIKHPVLMV